MYVVVILLYVVGSQYVDSESVDWYYMFVTTTTKYTMHDIYIYICNKFCCSIEIIKVLTCSIHAL